MITEQEQKVIFEKAKQDPLFWYREVLGLETLWGGQQQILEAFNNHSKIAVSSAHAMGKDYLGAFLILYFLYCFPPAIVLATAPSERQVAEVIWGEVSKMHSRSKYPLGGRVLSNEIKVDDKWYALGFTTKETNQKVGKFQGFHGENIFIVVTEAHAVDDVIFDQIDSLLVTANSRLYLAGNPLRAEGRFYEAFSNPTFKTFSFSAYESPNYVAGREVIPGMVTRPWVEEQERRYKRDDPNFVARVLGEFPKKSVYSLISISELRDAINNQKALKGYKTLAIDPARYGDDSTVFVVLNGGVVERIEEHQGKPTTETEGRAISIILEEKVNYVVVDEGAMGAGIFDHLEEMQEEIKNKHKVSYEIYGFNFGDTPFDSKFANLGTEMYFETCERILKGEMSLQDDPEMFKQFVNRNYKFNSKGKMMLEQKADLKSRGLESPDRADALVMAVFGNLFLHNMPYEDEEEEEQATDTTNLYKRRAGMSGYAPLPSMRS